jgi:ABC-type phosphate transport system auxiliary subunit
MLGVNASDALSSDISRFFTGSPTDKSMWLIAGGVVLSIVGVMGLTSLLKRKGD